MEKAGDYSQAKMICPSHRYQKAKASGFFFFLRRIPTEVLGREVHFSNGKDILVQEQVLSGDHAGLIRMITGSYQVALRASGGVHPPLENWAATTKALFQHTLRE